MVNPAGSSAARSAMYWRTTMPEASSGIGTQVAPSSSAAVGSAAASTKANRPSSSGTRSRSDTWAAMRRGVRPRPASTWNPR